MLEKKDCQIIYLNGPSSAGKSTLARALQEKLEKPFLIIGIDQLIAMMPDKLNDWHHDTKAPGFSWQPEKDDRGATVSYRIDIGPFGKRLVAALKDMALALATSGHYLIIDDVAFAPEQIEAWRTALKNYTVLWVGITAPLDILEQREKTRGDRKIGSARWQAERVHKNVTYDCMVDTARNSVATNLDLITSYMV